MPKNFLAVAFDCGGVATGPMTVPFIMALGIVISTIRSDSSAADDSFGLVALSSIGPIMAGLLLSVIFAPSDGEYVPVTIPEVSISIVLRELFTDALPKYMGEVALSILPIAVFFCIFQLISHVLKRTPSSGLRSASRIHISALRFSLPA